MAEKPTGAPTERRDTDESLHVERKKTDVELVKRQALIEARSHAVVQQARDEVDEARQGDRARADEQQSERGATSGERGAVRQARASQDAALRRERTSADQSSSGELQRRQQALARILRFEREQTDERLLIERARADASVAARDDFMSLVSHDLRTLLGGIALSAELQLKNPTADEAGQVNLKAAGRIQRLTARVNRLIGDLIDVASIEAGRFAVTPSPGDANALLSDSVEIFEPLASAKGIELGATLGEAPLVATFDHDRLLQLLANLVSNAIKFTGKGGTISLHVEPRPGELRFSVMDSGPGIATEQLDVIFERFWQVAKGDRRGLGLGLFISRCIIEAHGGRIWAESEPGKGSAFYFTLPLAGR
ncbi:MAG: sensor histidine kinase [Deltaproteobacteria bacterium]